MTLAFWTCAIVTLISSIVSCGYAIAGLHSSADDARTPSMYAFARSAALVVVAVIGLFCSSEAFVAAVTVAMILVQGIDAVIGAVISDRLKTIGPAFTAAAIGAALFWMLVA